MMSRGMVLNGAPLAAHAFTALPIATARAVAHERSGATVEDPLARKLLLGAGGKRAEELLRAGANVEYMSLRKTLGDELVREMYEGGHAVRQVVSIGAGLDSRAFRLPYPNVSYFEVDSQELFDMKEPLVVDLPLEVHRRAHDASYRAFWERPALSLVAAASSRPRFLHTDGVADGRPAAVLDARPVLLVGEKLGALCAGLRAMG